MKLGICYMVFDGEELLEFAASNIRSQADHISVTYQTTSYFGNKSDDSLPKLIQKLKNDKLIDEAVHYEPDLSLHPKENELKLRNLGLELSRKAGCTHHISSDVDEFYEKHCLKYVKNVLDKDHYDFCMIPMVNYYKDPTFLIANQPEMLITFIHPVNNYYTTDPKFPFKIEITRRLTNYQLYKVFDKEEITLHHMSYVRKDIRKKFSNSCNKDFFDLKSFYKNYDNHQLGDRVCVIPDYINRRTVKVENIFGIKW